MRFHLLTTAALAVTALAVAPAWSAEPVCEQSESTVTASPKGQRAASVQHQVCETAAGGVAAAITVYVGEAGAPLKGERVVSVAVPRSRDEWPIARWRGEDQLDVWVPNLANVLDSRPAAGDVKVALRYCADDPAERQRVAQYEVDLQRWREATSRWAEKRRSDPQGAGERPPRPAEPRVAVRACTDADLAP